MKQSWPIGDREQRKNLLEEENEIDNAYFDFASAGWLWR